MRELPDPGFSGDDGAVDPQVSQALAAYGRDPARLHAATLAVLQHSRVLVPVVAVLGEVGYDDEGLAHDKTSDMAAVLTTGRDGRQALLGFTGAESMRRWDPTARPVPVALAQAAQAALQDQASALVLDLAGPELFVIEEADLMALAEGDVLVEVSGGFGWARPAR